MEKKTDESLQRLNDYVCRLSGLIAGLDPAAFTPSECAQIYEVLVAIKSVAAAGRVMMETALA